MVRCLGGLAAEMFSTAGIQVYDVLPCPGFALIHNLCFSLILSLYCTLFGNEMKNTMRWNEHNNYQPDNHRLSRVISAKEKRT